MSPDRPLTTHGPVVRALIGFQALTAIGTVAALVIVIFALSGRLDKATERADVNMSKIAAIQASRTAAAFDSCRLIQSLVYSAAAETGNGPQAREGAARFLAANDLTDCKKYVRDYTQLKPRKVPSNERHRPLARDSS